MKHLLSVLFVFTLFISCTKEEVTQAPIDYVTQNEKEIKEFIVNNKLTAQKTNTGLYYIINEPGEGAQPNSSSTVTVVYKGTFINGKTFDQSTNAGITISLNEVIKGWKEGIPYFKTGGNGMLLIPSHLAYGSNNYQGIPGGSVLIFDIKLIEVKPN